MERRTFEQDFERVYGDDDGGTDMEKAWSYWRIMGGHEFEPSAVLFLLQQANIEGRVSAVSIEERPALQVDVIVTGEGITDEDLAKLHAALHPWTCVGIFISVKRKET